MREMKNSGIEWIGEIPADWKICKIKNKFSVFSGATPKSDHPEFWDGDIAWVTPADYKTTDKYITSGKRTLSDEGYNSCGTTIVPADSIVFSKRAPIGSVAISKNELCTNQGCLSCVIKSEENVLFYYYVLSVFTEIFELYGSGTTFREISFDAFSSFYIPAPSMREQAEIVDYLDQKCVEIDAIIEKTKTTIEEYKKLKQSVIIDAVTRGIRGNRPMKDSGIEWIGEIPADWAVIPFRYALKERQEKNSPIKSTERLSLSIDLGVTLYSEKTTNLDRFKEDFEQYKLAYRGDLVMNSMNMIVGATGVSEYDGCVSPAYYTFYDELEDHMTAKYCEYIFRSKAMLRILFSLGKGIYAIVRGDDRVNTCRLKVAKEDLRSIKIPFPAIAEQREIVSYIDQKCAEIDFLIAKKADLLKEMENYKKSIIYEYVTGKKEVL